MLIKITCPNCKNEIIKIIDDRKIAVTTICAFCKHSVVSVVDQSKKLSK